MPSSYTLYVAEIGTITPVLVTAIRGTSGVRFTLSSYLGYYTVLVYKGRIIG